MLPKKSHLDSAAVHEDGKLYEFLLDKLITTNKEISISAPQYSTGSIQALVERGYFIPSRTWTITETTSLSAMKTGCEHDFLLLINVDSILKGGNKTIDTLAFFLSEGLILPESRLSVC